MRGICPPVQGSAAVMPGTGLALPAAAPAGEAGEGRGVSKVWGCSCGLNSLTSAASPTLADSAACAAPAACGSNAGGPDAAAVPSGATRPSLPPAACGASLSRAAAAAATAAAAAAAAAAVGSGAEATAGEHGDCPKAMDEAVAGPGGVLLPARFAGAASAAAVSTSTRPAGAAAASRAAASCCSSSWTCALIRSSSMLASCRGDSDPTAGGATATVATVGTTPGLTRGCATAVPRPCGCRGRRPVVCAADSGAPALLDGLVVRGGAATLSAFGAGAGRCPARGVR
mmetsp:Transcript_101138/g.326442  ORF Transcript_101138/g.326442 Transcript_101138/m.326442 type:complete len:286 (-) Transcript_101138:1025-1882(-)